MVGYGQEAIISIISHLVFIGFSWWSLQSLNFEKFLRKNRVAQARLLYLLLAIALGSIVSNFFLDYLFWSRQLPSLFE
ncbi:DUF1146 family protein [Niallia sp. Krafla_26]|uniref:DUF1146 family protein n=1 Tax=Niallia sp. Krafla_26 TaxID=3064703 RepID=UPI003D16428A